MIVCYDSKTKIINKIIYGSNPIASFDHDIKSIFVEQENILIERGDKIELYDDKVKIGCNVIKYNKPIASVITDDNCNKTLMLDELF